MSDDKRTQQATWWLLAVEVLGLPAKPRTQP
jgi:hypothetical protein